MRHHSLQSPQKAITFSNPGGMYRLEELPIDILRMIFNRLGNSHKLSIHTLSQLSDVLALSNTCQALQNTFLSTIESIDLRPQPTHMGRHTSVPTHFAGLSADWKGKCSRIIVFLLRKATNLQELYLCHRDIVEIDIGCLQDLQINHLEIHGSYLGARRSTSKGTSGKENDGSVLAVSNAASSSDSECDLEDSEVIFLPRSLTSLTIGLGPKTRYHCMDVPPLKSLTIFNITYCTFDEVERLIEQQSKCLTTLSLSFHTCKNCDWGWDYYRMMCGLISMLVVDLPNVLPKLKSLHFCISAPLEVSGKRGCEFGSVGMETHKTIQRLRKHYRLHPSLESIHLECNDEQLKLCLTAMLPVLSANVHLQVTTSSGSIISMTNCDNKPELTNTTVSYEDDTSVYNATSMYKRQRQTDTAGLRARGRMEFVSWSIPACIPRPILRQLYYPFPWSTDCESMPSFSKLRELSIQDRAVVDRLYNDLGYLKTMASGFQWQKKHGMDSRTTLHIGCYISFISYASRVSHSEDVDPSEIRAVRNVLRLHRPGLGRVRKRQDASDVALGAVLKLLHHIQWSSVEITLPFDALSSRQRVIREVGTLNSSLNSLHLTSCYPSEEDEDDGRFGRLPITNQIIFGLEVLLDTLLKSCVSLKCVTVIRRKGESITFDGSTGTVDHLNRLLRTVEHFMACRPNVDVQGVKTVVLTWLHIKDSSTVS